LVYTTGQRGAVIRTFNISRPYVVTQI